MAEHAHHVGSARNASDYIAVTNFLIISKENMLILVTQEKPFKKVLNLIGKHQDWHWKSAKWIQLEAEMMRRKPSFGRSSKETKSNLPRNGTWNTRLLVKEKTTTGKTKSRQLHFCGINHPLA